MPLPYSVCAVLNSQDTHAKTCLSLTRPSWLWQVMATQAFPAPHSSLARETYILELPCISPSCKAWCNFIFACNQLIQSSISNIIRETVEDTAVSSTYCHRSLTGRPLTSLQGVWLKSALSLLHCSISPFWYRCLYYRSQWQLFHGSQWRPSQCEVQAYIVRRNWMQLTAMWPRFKVNTYSRRHRLSHR